jgi:hypothetical protein
MFHTVIVGGGVAGLHTGIELAKHGISCCIIEEYKCGGRVETYYPPLKGIHWENGAGRIHTSHRHVLHYRKKYNCTLIPLPTTISYLSNKEIHSNLFFDIHHAFLKPLELLPPHVLATRTIKEIVDEVMPHARHFYQSFPYYAETHTLRADVALKSFTGPIGEHDGFVVCKEGLSTMIDGMKKEFLSYGGKIIEDMRVRSVESVNNFTYLHCEHRVEKDHYTYSGKACVLAVPRDALEMLIKIPVVKQVLSHLTSVPLLRMYAVFDEPWFADLNSTVVDGPIRYIIPISDKVIMISYTEGPYALHWMRMKREKVEEAVMKEIRKLFPDRTIPDPVYFKMHSWRKGCTYWLPGNYSVEEMSVKILNPKEGIFVCGESYAANQCWVESALEHADMLLANPAFKKHMKS